ncbi:hypothetical protein BDFB_009248 [Asbolus verrucosus]|uniref:Uncharacterized protein n=1 Tax=Asbolus verrucosus TaxID=1661398 RepID=A0A482W7N3_ASBVE|nr:hypothetical protein BDFB_009248 [Asbolus verrucosus]
MSVKRRNREEKERDYKYTAVMRALVWRYVSAKHRKCEENAVTEDDINELKSDISSFRYEILEVLQRNGMDISCVERKERAVLGKKMKIWERRLMKDFKVAPVVIDEEAELFYQTPPEGEDSLAKFRRIAKLALLNSSLNKWRQVVRGACIASQIGHCHSRDSFKKQQNLQRAMEEAKKLKVKSPDQSRATTPIQLPDTTGSNIIKVIREFTPENLDTPNYLLYSSPNLFKKDNNQGPVISISPPESNNKKSDQGPDLIDLESTKTSPVLPPKSSFNNTKSSLESLDKIMDNGTSKSRSSDDNSLEDDKILRDSFPTSPASSDEKSSDSLNKKIFDNFTPDSDSSEKKSDDLTESKNVTFNFDVTIDSCKSDVKISSGILKKNDKAEEEIQDCDLTKDASEEKSDGVEKDDQIVDAQPSKDVEESKDNDVNKETEENSEKIKSVTVKEVCEETEKVTLDNTTAAADTKLLKEETEIEKIVETRNTDKSPLSMKNIRRIDDSGKRQPKTGWL